MQLTSVSRRAALAWSGALLFAPSAALAGTQATLSQLCQAGLDLGSAETPRQLKPHWCWAACIQTIFATHGYNVSQQEIVQKVFGDQLDQSANCKEILSGIDGRWTSNRGRPFQADGFVLWDRVANFERPDALQLAIRELQSGNPLIFANDRHTMVLTNMNYSQDKDGRITVESMTVRDPWPDSPNRHALGPDEIPRSGLLCGVHVSAVAI
jgi:hypothetical protein